MKTNEFIDNVLKNVSRVTHYESGGDGSGDGGCDCIGLIIGAIRLGGEKWTGTHGSNYSARNEMRTLEEISGVACLSVGDLVYKAKKPGESGYALPSGYKSHSCQLDFYHVGVVTSVDPLEITHCTGVKGGIKRDKTLGKWEYYGQLKAVQNANWGDSMSKYIVTDGKLRMRSKPSTSGSVITFIPEGGVIDGEVCSDDSRWALCMYDGKSGYCMTKYLKRLNNDEKPDGITLTAEQFEELVDCVNKLCYLLDNVRK